jgi:hypothetical protein
VDGTSLPAHGGGHRNRDTRTSRLRGQLAPGYALREPAPQPTRTSNNYPKERQSTELLGLDWLLSQRRGRRVGWGERST